MKYLTIGFFILSSMNSFAMSISEITNNEESDRAYLISNPSINEGKNAVGFNENSDGDGVCKAMGYSRFADRSISLAQSGSTGLNLEVDSSGSIKGIRLNPKAITEIVCVNKISKATIEAATLINPTYPNSELLFSHRPGTSSDGICKSQGFLKSYGGTILSAEAEMSKPRIIVDSNGKILSAPNDKLYITTMVCAD